MKDDLPFSRIVSLAPSITETLFALGLEDRIIGRTELSMARGTASTPAKEITRLAVFIWI